jgi:ribonuclease P protein component
MPSHRLTPARRIRRQEDFQRVFDRGRRIHGRYLTLVAAPNGSPQDRLGIVASKKLGGAVTRNRAKRLIREIFRRHQDDGPGRPGADIVVIPRPGMPDVSYGMLAKDFETSLGRVPRSSNS